MKGIILAGGNATRLYPVTAAVTKQLLPVYDKPMLYYPLCVLTDAGISDILVICKPCFLESYKRLLGDGSRFGVCISYAVQNEPRGIAEAFLLGRDFIDGDRVCLILGDNLFYGGEFASLLKNVMTDDQGATVFLSPVENPSDFGVCELDDMGNVISLEEKPKMPRSPYAVTGLYIYDGAVLPYAESLSLSVRGELEITDINRLYLQNGKLSAHILSKDTVWIDMGTPESLWQASAFIRKLQKETGRIVCCPEEIAYKKGAVSAEMLRKNADQNTEYGRYILRLTGEEA